MCSHQRLTGLATFVALVSFGMSGGAAGALPAPNTLEVAPPGFDSSTIQTDRYGFSLIPGVNAPLPAARSANQAPANSWTVLVYVHADHNLDESSVVDLQEMAAVGSSDSFRIVTQWDRLGGEGVTRGVVVKGDLEVVQKLPELNSDDPKNLAEFISWGVKAYPAARYGLVMWDHGGQWTGFGGDETNNGGGMGLADTRAGIEAGMAGAGLKQWDFLTFDSCLMGGLEILWEFAGLTKLYIAAPEIDYGDGWDYTATFGFLKANPGTDMIAFGKREVADWQAHHNNSPADLANRAQAAYDTSKVAALVGVVKGFSSALSNAWKADADAMARERGRVVEYSINPDDPHSPRPYVDLGDFASLAAAKSSDANLKSATTALNAAIDATIIAKALGKNNAKAKALSVWLPSDRSKPASDQEMQTYMKLPAPAATGWDKFLALWFGTVSANTDEPQIQITAKQNLENPTTAAPAKLEFQVQDQDLDTIYGSVGQPAGQDLYNLYGDLFYSAVNPGKYNTDFDGDWIVITDGKNTDYFCGFFQDPDDSLLYSSALYTPPGAKAGYEVSVVLDLDKLQVISVLDDSGPSPREIAVKPGGTLAFAFLQFNSKTEDIKLVPTGGSVTIPSGGLPALKVSNARLPAGQYSLTIGAVDWAGNESTQEVGVTIK